jgi:hypothetical protein
MPPLVLTVEERRSPLWVKLVRHWEAKQEAHRDMLERDLSELQTARVRGRLAEIKNNLGLNRDPKQFDPDPEMA